MQKEKQIMRKSPNHCHATKSVLLQKVWKSHYIGLVIIKDEVREIFLHCKDRVLVQSDECFWLSVLLKSLIQICIAYFGSVVIHLALSYGT